MNNYKLKLQDILNSDSSNESDVKAYALESFAKEIDFNRQTELLTHLILEHAEIAKKLEDINAELEQSREALAEAQEIALLGRWDTEFPSGIMTWSKSMYDIMELDSSLIASSELFFSVVHPDDLDEVISLTNEMYISQEPWTTRYRIQTKSGKVKWVHLKFFYKVDDDGNIKKLYGTIQDVTEMKKIEDILEKYNHDLEELVEKKVQEISSSQMATIFALIKLSESRDDDTGAHIERTASFCQLLARKAKEFSEYGDLISDSFIETIYKASPLHDIGKVGIPDSILLKPGKLTDEEFEVMKTHVQLGFNTLSKVGQQYDGNEFLKMGMDIALYHHEKWNGKGYLKGIVGSMIPLSARIMALSDVYDALRSKRVYKEAFSHERSMEIIASDKGIHFDPVLVDVIMEFQEEFKLLYESIK